ncbi:hypothetical protein GCM10027517_17880 [Phycicoccus ginsengisoli]
MAELRELLLAQVDELAAEAWEIGQAGPGHDRLVDKLAPDYDDGLRPVLMEADEPTPASAADELGDINWYNP